MNKFHPRELAETIERLDTASSQSRHCSEFGVGLTESERQFLAASSTFLKGVANRLDQVFWEQSRKAETEGDPS